MKHNEKYRVLVIRGKKNDPNNNFKSFYSNEYESACFKFFQSVNIQLQSMKINIIEMQENVNGKYITLVKSMIGE